jgi:hypothetical protein
MILPCDLVEFSIINAHTPTSGSSMSLFFSFLATVIPPFFGTTEPLTVRNRVDNSSLEQFKHLILYYFPHRIIDSALMLPDRLMVLFHGNAMGAKAQTNPFEICKGITND